MKSFIRELVRVAEFFFPMLIFCLVLYSQLMRGEYEKPVVPKETTTIAAAKPIENLSKQQEQPLYMFFEQLIR